MRELLESLLRGDTRAAARLCRAVDDRLDGYRELLRELYPHTGKAWILGVTGNPGAGKSTLTDRLIEEFRKEHDRVAVVAVDPTSPFSGGAILGDRIRMQRHFEDAGVFIRSVATRGALGGLSRSAMDLVRVLDGWGARVVLVETVGVGQDELEVTRQAHTTLVVMPPGLGDDVQANKAGLLECADVFAVNKADRAGADATVRDLENMLALSSLSLASSPGTPHGHSAAGAFRTSGSSSGDGDRWTPPIVKTVSTRGEGVAELVERLKAHRAWLEGTEAGRKRWIVRLHEQLLSTLRDELAQEVATTLEEAVRDAARRVAEHETDPYTACEALILAFRSRLS